MKKKYPVDKISQVRECSDQVQEYYVSLLYESLKRRMNVCFVQKEESFNKSRHYVVL